MRKIIFLILFIFQAVVAQERDALLEGLFEEEMTMEKQLLPQKMIFTQSLLWGKNGLFRTTGISKLSIEKREKELKVRNVMLKSHQIIGYLTLAGMVAQGIMGGRLYNGDYELYDAHKTLGQWVTASYFTGANFLSVVFRIRFCILSRLHTTTHEKFIQHKDELRQRGVGRHV